MRRPSPLPRLSLLALGGLAALVDACARLPTEPERFAYVTDIAAPTALAASTPLTVNLRYQHGACESEQRVTVRIVQRTISIAVVMADDPIPPGVVACISLLKLGETSAFIPTPPRGLVTLRIHRTGLEPLERTLIVGEL